MKFSELRTLFSLELEKAKRESKPAAVRFVVAAYKKVIKIISAHYGDDEVVNANKIDKLPITDHMKDKLIKVSKKKVTTEIRKLYEKEKLYLQLTNILGIGAKKVNELIDAGLKKIEQLEQPKYFNMLNADTQVMLKHKPIRKIPREYIEKIEEKIVGFSNAHVQLVGSYRRRAPYSKDVDVLIRADGNVLDKYIEYMRDVFQDRVYIYSQGKDKVSLIIQAFARYPIKIKLDIFRCSTETYYTNLLYSTGPKEFNIRMRGRARKLGYLLNQNGLFDEAGNKVNGVDDDEKKLFKIVGMSYLEPWERK
jgi:DNA polymerase/3'-5' exonuclease PolX